jgi:hypothetical protein
MILPTNLPRILEVEMEGRKIQEAGFQYQGMKTSTNINCGGGFRFTVSNLKLYDKML